MKKILFNAFFITIVVLIYSCGQQAKNNHEHAGAQKKTKAENHVVTDGELRLDNGKPWTANPETTTGINNMIAILNDFPDKENPEAYGELAEKLEHEFNMIFQKCTMTGEAHNQLHNFLLPIKDQLEILKSQDLTKCKDSFERLKTHLGVYKNYFK